MTTGLKPEFWPAFNPRAFGVGKWKGVGDDEDA